MKKHNKKEIIRTLDVILETEKLSPKGIERVVEIREKVRKIRNDKNFLKRAAKVLLPLIGLFKA